MSDMDDIPEPDKTGDAPHPRRAVHLFGQSAVEQQFIDAMKAGSVHHAWLVTGPRGIGKATLAWRMARGLIALSPNDPVPDDLSIHPDSPVFRRMAALGEPRLFLCRRPWNEKTKRLSAQITVDEVRRLKSFFTMSATDGGWRVAIIDAADDMNSSAANALLKVLEEPPDNVCIILVAHQPGRLLPTIRSRCRSVSLSPLDPDNLGLALDSIGLDVPPDMTALHQLAEGSVGQAVDLLSGDGDEIYGQIIKTMASCPNMDRGLVLDLADACVGPAAAPRYALTLRLIQLALGRLAKGAVVEGGLPEATDGEAAMHARIAPSPTAAARWAELVQSIGTRTDHAVSVNLDPGHVILDTFLQIEAVAAKTSV